VSAAKVKASAVTGPVLRLEHVSKVFCDSLNVARRYAMTDLLRPQRGRESNLRKHEFLALHDVSLELEMGQTLLVLGVPDSGKTTLADIITGQRAPDAGKVERRGSVGVLGGGKYGQNPFMKLREQARLIASLQGVHADHLSRVVDEILEWTGLRDCENMLVFDLPKPIISPMSLVSSLLVEHEMYVFDDYKPPRIEDPKLEKRVRERLEEIFATRACVVLDRGTNAPDKVDEVIILHGGEIIFRGKEPDEALDVYQTFFDLVRYKYARPSGARGHHRRIAPPVDEARTIVRDIVLNAGSRESILERELARIWAMKRPILVGPCLADLSWEVLYWLPFVKWARRRMGDPQPAVALSKSSVGAWYEEAARTFVDVYDLLSPSEFDTRDQQRRRDAGSAKQAQLSKFERELSDLAAARVGLPDVETLHPSVLLSLFARVRRGRISVSELTSRAVYERLSPPAEMIPDLPATYVALSVRFTSQFPNTAETRALVSELVRGVSAKIPIVAMGDVQWAASEPLDGGNGVHVIDPSKTPERLHRIQASVIGGAQAAIGTLVGPVMVAPFLGVPTMCLYAPGGFVDFQTSVFRFAADRLETPATTAALGSVTAADVETWLERVLERRPSVAAGADRP
jgi:ABC-type polysaccharide/polyol phosphate transport system ATPase subunit